MFINCVFVGIGGMAGSILRYLMGLIPVHGSSGFPIITLLINLIGSFLIGAIATLAGRSAAMDPHLLLLLKVGLCGGFTTFSTFALETEQLLQNGRVAVGITYAVVSVAICVIAALLGQTLVGRG
jgi:CrcB protein